MGTPSSPQGYASTPSYYQSASVSAGSGSVFNSSGLPSGYGSNGIGDTGGWRIAEAAAKAKAAAEAAAQKEREYVEAFANQLKKAEEGSKKGSRTLIGATSLTLINGTIKYDSTLHVDNDANIAVTSDLASFPDRATITSIINNRGYNCYLTKLQIHGKPVIRCTGTNGKLTCDSLKRDDDIRRNGEHKKKITNDYIFDATQVVKIADFWFQKCGKKLHSYAISIPGTAYWYEPGDWYTLQAGASGYNEYINSTVECYNVDIEHNCKDIGSTTITFVEVMENWAKHTSYTARMISSSSARRRLQQSNTVIVAASSFGGSYNYRCDGTDDHIQIQAAMDYLSSIGGGIVYLTAGIYILGQTITMKDNVWIQGAGTSTKLCPYDASIYPLIDWYYLSPAINSGISLLSCDGNGITLNASGDIRIIDCGTLGKVQNVDVCNFSLSRTGGNQTFNAIYYYEYASNCTVHDIILSQSDTDLASYIIGFNLGSRSNNNIVENCSATGKYTSITGFSGNDLSTCCFRNNTITGSQGTLAGFSGSVNITSCSVLNNTGASVLTNFSIRGFTTCNNLAACVNTGNSVDNSIAYIYGFSGCNRISVSRSYSNSGAAANTIGFGQCKTVTHCTSTDTTPYSASYADSGTSNACADTSSGGFNS